MILAFGGARGSGKTTLAVNLAVMRAAQNREVLLVDADPSGAAAEFTAQRQDPELNCYTCVQLVSAALAPQVRRLGNKFDDVIIDLGSDLSVEKSLLLQTVQTLVLPISGAFDLWELKRSASLLDQVWLLNRSLRACVVLNKFGGVDSAETLHGELTAIKRFELLEPRVSSSPELCQASAAGLAAVEAAPTGELQTEFTQLFEELFEISWCDDFSQAGNS